MEVFVSDPTKSPLIYTLKKLKELEKIDFKGADFVSKKIWEFRDMSINSDI